MTCVKIQVCLSTWQCSNIYILACEAIYKVTHTPMWLFLVLKLKKKNYLVVVASPDRPLAQQSTKRPILISVLWCISEIEIVYIKPWIKLWRVTMVILVPLTIALDRTDVELLETYFLYIQQNNFISLMPLHIMIAQVNSGSFWLYVQD